MRIDGHSHSDWRPRLMQDDRLVDAAFFTEATFSFTHWSRAQPVTLSSAEAELHSICQCALEGLSLRNTAVKST